MDYSLKTWVITNRGLIRDNNEDNFFVNGKFMTETERQKDMEFSAMSSRANQIFAICDGAGGELMGETASLMIAEALRGLEYTLDSGEASDLSGKAAAINKMVYEANLRLCGEMRQLRGRMGSTLSGLHVYGGKAVTFNIGDSRVYLFRDNELRQLTRDHTEAQRLIRLGIIDEEQARQHKSMHVLTRHFGISPDEEVLEADIGSELEIKPDDIFLLCSDGLTDMVTDGMIKKILAETERHDSIHIRLVEEALKNGGHDNITVILVKVC